jgi:hypothetical protein
MNDDLWSVDLGHGIGPIKLGEPRDQVLQRLLEAGIEVDSASDDPHWIWLEEMDLELNFTQTQPPILHEIGIDDDRVRLGPLPVIGKLLHEVVDSLHVPDAETRWQREGLDEQIPTPSDEHLLSHGILWIPSLGLGLGMDFGEVMTVLLRQPQDTPQNVHGPLTPSQRALSARDDLISHLYKTQRASAPVRPQSWPQRLLTLALFAAIGLIIWRAIDYQLRWNASPTVEAEVIDIKPPPPYPFPDEFTVTYPDQAGRQHQAVLKRSDVYGPLKVGDKTEIRYRPEAPDHPLGPARVGDAAFEKFIPWGIGVFAAYLVLQTLLAAASWLVPRPQQPQANPRPQSGE